MPRNLLIFRRLNEHIAYFKGVESALAGREPFDPDPADRCALGRWLHGGARSEVRGLGPDAERLLEDLHDPHERFHALSERALALRRSGDEAGAEAAYAQARQASKQLLDLLIRLDRLAHRRPG
jgi:hypothetical protein